MSAKKKGDKPNRVQGLESRLSDLTLRDGRKLAVELGGSILPTPTLTRTIDGSSSISLSVYDPELKFLKVPLLAQKWDAEIDGLHFRYLACKKTGRQLSMTLEDRWVAVLREPKGPKSVLAHRGKKNEVTRAEFIKSLVHVAAPKLEFVCPQLHDPQPIAKKEQAKQANQDAKDRREPGIGDAKHLTVGGAKATKPQLELGETALRIANGGSAPYICKVAVIAALMDESSMGTASPGNVLEALEPYTKVRPAEEEISGFLFGEPTWTGVTAVGYAKRNPEATFFQICQAVQKSGAGELTEGAANYGKFGDEAREWVEAFDGVEGEGGIGGETVVEPFKFTVGKDENYWEAIQRLAKEVNWRAFIVGNRFYYIDELELARGIVRLALDPDTPGIPPANVDFDFNRNKKVNEVRVKVPVKQWKPPPGSVVTVAGYGPASVGFGDAPQKKGQRTGLSSNRNAKTGEGRGRYVLSSIAVPITEGPDARYASVTLRRPTPPLPEPAAKTKTLGGTGSVSSGESGASAEALADVSIPHATPGAPYWGGSAAVFKQFVHPFMEDHGLSPGGEKEQGHEPLGDHDPEGQPSGYATDYPTNSGEAIARALASAMGNPEWKANSYDSFTIEVDGYRFDVQILWGSGIEHGDHIHVGMHRI